MYLDEFIDYLNDLPKGTKLAFHKLKKDEWVEQDTLDIDITEDKKTVNFYLYNNRELEPRIVITRKDMK